MHNFFLKPPTSNLQASPRRFAVQGFSLLETLLVIAIVLILITIVVSGLSAFRDRQALQFGATDIASFIGKARSQTLSGVGGVPYGIHTSAQSLTLFSGITYTAGAAGNEVFTLPSSVQLVSITLAGGGSDILFQQVTGKTSQPGTLVLQLGSNAALQKTITIAGTGIIGVQ